MSDQRYCKECGNQISLDDAAKFDYLCENCRRKFNKNVPISPKPQNLAVKTSKPNSRPLLRSKREPRHIGASIFNFFFWGISTVIFLMDYIGSNLLIAVIFGVIAGLIGGWAVYRTGFRSCCKIFKNEET